MPMDHISNESMRSYLLGQLPDDQAAALEEEYFSDRDFFLKIQAAETALIAEYLDGRLPTPAKHYFESRYLQIPLLRRKVEEVRRQRSVIPATRTSVWTSWRLAFAAVPLILLGLGIWAYRSHLATELVASKQPHPTQSVIAIRISGSVKGLDSKPTQFDPPISGSSIKLVLELPGQSSPAQYQVRISNVNFDGRWMPVWNSPEPLVSLGDGDGQALTIKLEGALLQPGDYVVAVTNSDGRIRETYVYRVSKVQSRDH